MKKYSYILYSIFSVVLLCQPLTLGMFNPQINHYQPIISDGTILYVGGSGPGNYTTIQQAIDVADSGDTVYIYDDSSPYNEHLIISESILLQGENQATTVIDGNNTGDVITMHADNTTIQDFTIMRSGDDWPRCAGIRILADRAILSQLICQQTQTGIILTATTGSTITDCTLKNNDVSIYLENDSTANTIADNTVQASSFDYQFAFFSCPNNTIEGNAITNPENYGIYVYDSPGMRLRNNTVTGCEEGIVFIASNDSEITGNVLQNNTVYGISIGSCTGLTISDNAFWHDGLFLYECHDNTLTNNTANSAPITYLENIDNQIVSQNGGQIILINCTNINVQDSIIQDVCIAVQCWDCTNCVITNNILTSNLCGIYLSGCSQTDVTENTINESRWEIFLHPIDITDCYRTTISDNDITFTDEFTSISISTSDTVVFSHNILHGKHNHAYNGFGCGYSQDIAITDNTIESGNIELAVCMRATVRSNTLLSGTLGCDSSRIVRVLGNDIHPKDGGIYLRNMILTILRDNIITSGIQAVSLESCLFTQVIGNSFIDCGDEPATFTNSLRNHWLHNYWGSGLSGPKIIHGTFNIIISDLPPRVITIPMINIDLIPKRTSLQSIGN